MNQKIKVSNAIQYGILAVAILLFIMIWPTAMIQKSEVSKSEEVILEESGPISVANNGTQMFIAQGPYLKSVDLYVLNEMQSQTITFRIYDGAYKQLWETFYVVDEKAQFPGFVHINVDMEMEEGWEYYYTVEGLTNDLYLAYEDTYESTSFANGTLLYGGEELPGKNIIIRYHYKEPFSWWMTLLFAVLIFVPAGAICLFLNKRFANRWAEKNKEITVQKAIQTVANPLLALAMGLALIFVFPLKIFGVGKVNYAFYGLGIVIGAAYLFYAINHKRKSNQPILSIKQIKENAPEWFMAICFAGVLWSCCQYMNGLYNIHHTLATCKLLIWFGLALVCTFKKEQVISIFSLIYWIVACVASYFYIKPHVGMEEEWELYKLQAYVMMVGGFVLLQIILSVVQMIRKKQPPTAKWNLLYTACLSLWLVLMVVFRNTREWIILMAVLLVTFTVCMWMWEKRDKLLWTFSNGIILNFCYTVWYCLQHRPYLRFRHNRYGMIFHTVTMTGYYLALVLCAVIVRLFVQYYKTGRWQDCYKELALLGMGNVYLFLTLSRTGYLAAFVVEIFTAFLLGALWQKQKIKAIFTNLAIIIVVSIAAFPVVFTAQRMLPAVCNDPIYSEIEVWEYVVEKGDPKDSENYIDIIAFLKVAGNKLFGKDMGNISLSYRKSEIPNREANKLAKAPGCLSWKKHENPVYIQSDNYQLASDAEMYEKQDVSNGRFDIFAEYIGHWNLTGHELMGVPLADGTISTHAHNTFLQLIHDNGLITGIVFLIFGVYSYVLAMYRYCKEKNKQSYLLLSITVFMAFAAAGMVEWIFHICNPFGFAILVVITPLLWKQKKQERQ